ncbi:MAG: excinuclease ABC subunit UvrA [Desulfobacterales bacterium]|nr:excinuclease ABC subunit UvrA [Desulfobacterales bacterium]
MKTQSISVKGARQHNLKNLDIDIPLNRITVVTGVSGSGKSSLAFDTLYAEGQRRYVETFSPYARQFMDRMDRPQVDKIEGIPPAIAIDRKDPVRTSRSTVGTMTEITDYVKLLYARLGELHCQMCGQPVKPETPAHVWNFLISQPPGAQVVITFPYQLEGSPFDEVRRYLMQMGFDRLYLENRIVHLDEWQPAKDQKRIPVLVDRVILRDKDRERILDSLELAYRFGGGQLDIWVPPHGHKAFSNQLQCAKCHITYNPPLPNLFSFNSPLGACDTCRGFGRTIGIDMDLIIPDPSRSLADGAIKPFGSEKDGRMEYDDLMDFCRRRRISTRVPFKRLKAADKKAIIEGTSNYYGVKGLFRWLERKTYKMPVRVFLSRYRSYDICPDCDGARFKDETLLYRLADRTIAQVYQKNVLQALDFFNRLRLPERDEAGLLVRDEVRSRLTYLKDVGLGYLTLDRQSRTLSGGEVQRVALASALGSSLVNTLYVLDEPSIGLHPRDNHRLIRILKGLRNLSNTVVVVEHDPEIIRESDFLLDLGPRAGEKGGEVMYFGPTANVNGSLTGQYLKGKRRIEHSRQTRRPDKNRWITIKKAAENNLKNIDVRIPLGMFVCLTGVSGSGKSTLAEEILYKAVKRALGDPQDRPGRHQKLTGINHIDDVVLIDQRAIGRTPRANALTYTKALDPIRKLLAATEDARAKNFGPGYFSFNVDGGRCETCKGDGFEKVEMQFLSDVFITCPDCKGRRFTEAILQITYQGKNINDILNLTVSQALDFFIDQSKIVTALQPLAGVGLSYLRLGQPINTLSGGEAQRLKLSRHLKSNGKRAGQRLFIFDEPTTGLHFDDIGKLLASLQRLVDDGNTVLVIEHNMDVVKTADWVIDLGPEGGDDGGQLVASGTPQKIAQNGNSHTGRFLKAYLEGKGRLKRPTSGRPAEVADPMAAFGASATPKRISLKGAREHNLKNISLTVPQNELVVLSGVSGSGKSTLAFDILFAEGQRRYLESLAPYVRQYMKILERPDVDLVTGLAPTVAIEQRISHSSRRSTVATLTEIYHFLRLLFSKLGHQHCPGCDRQLTAQSQAAIVKQLRQRYARKRATMLATQVFGRKGFHKDVLARALKKGFKKARIDGRMTPLKEGMALSRYHEHTIELVVGRLPSKNLAPLVDKALKIGNGSLTLVGRGGHEEIYSLSGTCPTCGISLEPLDPRLFSFNSKQGACPDCGGLGVTGILEIDDDDVPIATTVCVSCAGSRLKPQTRAVKVGGHSIWDLVRKPAQDTFNAIKKLKFPAAQKPIAEPVVNEILTRLSLLNQLGLSYLSLSRSGDTLSGGEAQRVRLAAQLGSNLTGVCYILDEPTIGLHARDNGILIDALKTLRDRGNSILVVEHDEETIRAADTIIDLGPGAGQDGGKVVASGGLHHLKKVKSSITGALIDGHAKKISSRLRPYRSAKKLFVQGAKTNNLKNISARFPLGRLVCITGVSGSGKSSLLKETLYKGLRNRLQKKNYPAGQCKDIKGWQQIQRVLEVDHSPIGRTPRSVPASYVGFLSEIRKLFSLTPTARARGYKPGRFSFNVAEGRCDACKGQGRPKVKMSFLPDVYVPCEICRGKRYNKETLAIQYKGKSMADVLEMTFAEAVRFFSAVPNIRRAVQFVCDVGLGYLCLGQPSPTLSGGEAQRIKLAKQLVKRSNGHTFYILDEPTTGLHLADIMRLINVLQALVDEGNTVAIIEHNMEIIKEADHIIDLGPEGGDQGGRVVATGSPAELLKFSAKSHTARCFQRYLNGSEVQGSEVQRFKGSKVK